MKNTVHNMKWSAQVKISKLQKVKGAQRAEPKPHIPANTGMQFQSKPAKVIPTF